MLDVGAVVAGRYRLTKKLGEGGMGAVFVAVQEPLGREVAVKVIIGDLAKDEQAVERFKREATTLSTLSHPNIVTIFDFGSTDDGTLFLVMELLRGESLKQRLARVSRMSGCASLPIIRDIASALAVAHHAGVIHRDLKPDNVMLLDLPGQHDLVRLLDFGVAKSAAGGNKTLTQAGMIVGTPGYMAPELVLQGITDDPRSDLYALGVVWFEMLAGSPLFTAPTPMALVMRHATEKPPSVATLVDVDAQLSAFIDRLLDKDPNNRPASAHDVILRIDDMMRGGPAAKTMDGSSFGMQNIPVQAAAAAPSIPTQVTSSLPNALAAPPTPLPPPPTSSNRKYAAIAAGAAIIVGMNIVGVGVVGGGGGGGNTPTLTVEMPPMPALELAPALIGEGGLDPEHLRRLTYAAATEAINRELPEALTTPPLVSRRPLAKSQIDKPLNGRAKSDVRRCISREGKTELHWSIVNRKAQMLRLLGASAGDAEAMKCVERIFTTLSWPAADVTAASLAFEVTAPQPPPPEQPDKPEQLDKPEKPEKPEKKVPKLKD